MHTTALFSGRLDPTAMHALIMNLTRPVDRTPSTAIGRAGEEF